MRLKSLRRGIQDAGYIALARSASPGAVDAIVKEVIPAALDEALDSAPRRVEQRRRPVLQGALRAARPHPGGRLARRRRRPPRARRGGGGPPRARPAPPRGRRGGQASPRPLGRWSTTARLIAVAGLGAAVLALAIGALTAGGSLAVGRGALIGVRLTRLPGIAISSITPKERSIAKRAKGTPR